MKATWIGLIRVMVDDADPYGSMATGTSEATANSLNDTPSILPQKVRQDRGAHERYRLNPVLPSMKTGRRLFHV